MKMIDLVKNQQVHFEYYRDGEMWYKTDNGFIFPVPIHDTKEIGNATFNRDDKAILFMRYIRKYKEELDKEAKENLLKKWEAKKVIGLSDLSDDLKESLATIIPSE